jgi:hypothetical protein
MGQAPMAFLFLLILATESTEFTEEKAKNRRAYQECRPMVKAKLILWRKEACEI